MTLLPLISHNSADSVFAYRAGQAILVAKYLHDVAHLAQQMPDGKHILNLCHDRYQFAVGFAAALLRQQTSLLPPNFTASQVERLRQSYPDMYCLADRKVEFEGVEVVHYPQCPELLTTMHSIPTIPSDQQAALVFTSGSTGKPIAHGKTWGSLCKGAVVEAKSLGIVQHSGMAILGTVPSQHMYGLESCIILAIQNGLALVSERPFYPADIYSQLSALPHQRCLVTTPVHLRTLLAEEIELPSVELVLCATAHLSSQLASEAESRFASPLYEIYGFTEAGMVASRRTTQSDAWHLLPGVKLSQNAQGNHMSGGHIEIESPVNDVIELKDDGTFILHGRSTDTVNIFGKRTSLDSLNYHLNQIPGVQDGVIFVQDDNGQSLNRPIAFVVAPRLCSEDILSALRNSLDPVFLPRPLYFVDALPRNATGKLTFEALTQLLECCSKK